MATAVIMPRQGQSVESCMIGKWHKRPGDAVAAGETLFSYETDKAAFDETASAAGKLLAVFFQEGDDVPCLETVCVIGEEGEDVSAFAPAAARGGSGNEAAPRASAAESAPCCGAAGAGIAPPASAAPGAVSAAVSPRAENLAARHGVDPATLTGSGPGGRVIERDVEAALSGAPRAAAESAATAAPEADFYTVKHSQVRKATARAMAHSLSTMAQLTLNASFDAGVMLSLRKRLKAAAESGGPLFKRAATPTLGDMALFAAARVLGAHPALNAHYDDEKATVFRTVNLGVAVDTPRGLMVPTIRGAEKLTLQALSARVKALAAECRGGAVAPDALKGASFTVTNLGAYGVESFTPVINPPQVAILGVCGVSQRVRGGAGAAPCVYDAMGLSLTIDHRAVDGAPAAQFLKDLCAALENFDLLLV